MSEPIPKLEIDPPASADETAAIVAALAALAASTVAPAREAPSRWRLAARRYGAFERDGHRATSGDSF